MKVLVIGKRGYIAESFVKYATTKYELDVKIIDSRSAWKTEPFENYNTIIVAAGIAHRRQTKENKHLYYEVNRDLALAIANKAKAANVGHFIYLSSMSVYGIKQGEITKDTIPNPANNDYYGHSKHEAELLLKELESEHFKIAIIRPPMVYGKNCPGKFSQLLGLSKFLFLLPDTNNKRSIIYIDNLCEFLYKTTINQEQGIFCPQNGELANTGHIIKLIRLCSSKSTIILPLLSAPFKLAMTLCPPLKNAFSSLYYTPEKSDYQIFNLKESIYSLCSKTINEE